ncbi:tail fiber protein [Haemophilus parahaemolyticus]
MKTRLNNIQSNTGRFVDGNPASGQLGTIVTAKWLNGVQERLQDIYDEMLNVVRMGSTNSANAIADPNQTNQVANAIRNYLKSKFSVELTTENANNLTTDGIYAYHSGDMSNKNLPTPHSYHLSVIGGSNGGWVHQIAKRAYSLETYERTRATYDGDWTAWERVDNNAKTAQIDNVNSDLNNEKTTGLYSVGVAINRPEAYYGFLTVIANADKSTVRQIYRLIDRLTTYERWFKNNQWSEWKRTDGIAAEGISNQTLAEIAADRSKVVQYSGNAKDKLAMPDGAYGYGSLLALNSGKNSKGLLYIGHDGSQVWAKGIWNSDLTQPWKRLDGAEWADVRGKPATLNGYSTVINHPSANLIGKRNDVGHWFVGLPNDTSEEFTLHNYRLDTSIRLKSDRVEMSKAPYFNGYEMWHKGNLVPLFQQDHRIAISGSQIAYQDATPEQLPFGTYVGYCSKVMGYNSSGWQMTSKSWTDATGSSSMVKLGILNNRLFFQQARNYQNWQDPVEVLNHTQLTTRQLNQENLNNITIPGLYGQNANAGATTAFNYPIQEAGSLVVTPSAYGVQQEYTTFWSNRKFVRGKQDNNWLPWKRVDGLDLTDILIGVPIPHPLSTVPAGCLAMNGQRFDTRRYPKLAQKYPSGVLPDLRGEFIRGWDNERGVDAWRGVLSTQEDAIQRIHGGFSTLIWRSNILNEDLNKLFILGAFTNIGPGNERMRVRTDEVNTGSYFVNSWVHFNSSGTTRTSTETRPRNIAFHYICLAA